MGASILYPLLALGGSTLVVAGKIIYDKMDHKVKFKYDKVTDLRLKRKSYNDSKYKSDKNTTRTTKGI